MQNLFSSTTRAPGAADAPAVERASLPETGFVRQKLLLRVIPFSKTTLWRRVQSGEFPKPVRLSQGITAWRAEDLRRWIQQWQ
jgi:prophage regulatory protein